MAIDPDMLIVQLCIQEKFKPFYSFLEVIFVVVSSLHYNFDRLVRIMSRIYLL